jgi:hypothetical protein
MVLEGFQQGVGCRIIQAVGVHEDGDALLPLHRFEFHPLLKVFTASIRMY